MRISTAQYYGTQASDYQRNFNKAVATASEASSLQRINTAADDPIGAGRLLQLGQQAAMLDQYNTNISSSTSLLHNTIHMTTPCAATTTQCHSPHLKKQQQCFPESQVSGIRTRATLSL